MLVRLENEKIGLIGNGNVLGKGFWARLLEERTEPYILQKSTMRPEPIFLYDSRAVVSVNDSNTICYTSVGIIHDTKRKDYSESLKQITALACSLNGKWLAVGGESKKPGKYAVALQWISNSFTYILEGSGSEVTKLSFSKDGQLLAVATNHKYIEIWSTEKDPGEEQKAQMIIDASKQEEISDLSWRQTDQVIDLMIRCKSTIFREPVAIRKNTPYSLISSEHAEKLKLERQHFEERLRKENEELENLLSQMQPSLKFAREMVFKMSSPEDKAEATNASRVLSEHEQQVKKILESKKDKLSKDAY